MAAQSCKSCKTQMPRRNRIFRDGTHPFDTDIRWWIHFQEIQTQTRRHCDHNYLHWEGHCDQQSDRFLKLTPLLQVSLVTWRSLPVVVVSKTCVASWSGWVCSETSFISNRLWGVFRYPTDIDFRSNSTPYRHFTAFVTAWLLQWTHRPFKCHFIQENLLTLSKVYLSHSLMCLDFYDQPRNRNRGEKVKINKFSDAADDRQSAADKARPINIEFSMSFANALWLKERIFPV